jgi:glycosyltransferase involved in cell wall biosynthesis
LQNAAVSGNLGVSMARGDYVALVDSDDVIMPQGYALLMRQAIECNADIVVGRAARFDGNILPGPFLFEPFVWTQHRIVESVRDFPDLMHDGFYWNKVFRTDFLRQYGLGMVPGLLYADRPFVHKAYYYSRKTVVIPELVYLWRVRAETSARSITQSKSDASNYLDRMRSVRIEWQDFEGIPDAHWYRLQIAVSNLQRALHVMPEIISSPSFRAMYVTETCKLLELYGDLDYRALGGRRCMLLHMLAKGELEGLCYLLGRPVQDQVVELDGAVYWRQPFLDNKEFGIDREVARIAFPTIGFFKLISCSLMGSQLEIKLEMHDLIWEGCTVDFELHALYGEGSFPFQSLGRQGEHLYGYAIDLTECEGSRGAAGCSFNLAMRYTQGDVNGMYRMGVPLLKASLFESLPLTSDGYQVVCGPETGGYGVILPAQDAN